MTLVDALGPKNQKTILIVVWVGVGYPWGGIFLTGQTLFAANDITNEYLRG
jgi:hypothetical protein